MRIYNEISQLIGNTPLLHLRNYEKSISSNAKILAKLEYFNPAGSTKDRVAAKMIADAEECGALKKGATIIEPTSGNTGIGLASIAASKGYKVILTMPDTMSIERRNLLKAYGAEIVLTPGSEGMNGAIKKAIEFSDSIEGSFVPSQFDNPSNPMAHLVTTGPEIWEDTDGNVDIFIAGVGTGGTISGVGKYLKSKNKNIKIIAVEPASSPVLSGGKSGLHGLQGIGAGFIPKNLDTDIYDAIIRVKEEDAYNAGRFLAENEGILVGITSGAAVFAAGEIAKKEENNGKTIVALLPDTGERYMSTPMFSK